MKQSISEVDPQKEDNFIIGFNEELLLESENDPSVFGGRKEEFLDKDSLDNEFYTDLKRDIDVILLKAWEGKENFTEEELDRFRDLMKYRQG